MEDTPTIWKTDPNNSWRLYNHTDYNPPQVAPEEKENKDKKNPNQTKPQISSAFSFTKAKPATKGSVTCTSSKGYGIIHAFNEEKGTVSVKIEGKIHELPQEEVLNDIPLNIVFLSNSTRMEEIMYMPITSTMNEFIERLENSLENTEGYSSVSLYSQGKEISGSNETLEKLKILPSTKYLGIVTQKPPLVVKRYTNHTPGWSIGIGNQLGITFSPSSSIKVIGFAMHAPSSGSLTGMASFYDSAQVRGDATFSKTVTINQTERTDEFEKIMFNKPFVVKAGEFASVVFTAKTANHNVNYGSGGLPTAQGEGEVNFAFKTCEGLPYLHGYDSGPVPEIYYYK